MQARMLQHNKARTPFTPFGYDYFTDLRSDDGHFQVLVAETDMKDDQTESHLVNVLYSKKPISPSRKFTLLDRMSGGELYFDSASHNFMLKLDQFNFRDKLSLDVWDKGCSMISKFLSHKPEQLPLAKENKDDDNDHRLYGQKAIEIK